jgi:hypothetical protein
MARSYHPGGFLEPVGQDDLHQGNESRWHHRPVETLLSSVNYTHPEWATPKPCTKCGGGRDTTHSWCKPCMAAHKRAQYIRQRDNSKPYIAKSGPTVDFYPLWTWIEENLGRTLDHLTQVHTVLPDWSYQTIRHWRNNGIRIPTACRIATHFGTWPADIWPGTGPWPCTTPHCEADAKSLGLCNSHRKYLDKHGIRPTSNISPRFIRLPFQPLADYLRIYTMTMDLTAGRWKGNPGAGALSEICGVDRRTFQDWTKNGVTLDAADRVAVHLGTVPTLIWGHAYHADILEPLELAA